MNIFEILTQESSVHREVYETVVYEQNAWVTYLSFLAKHLNMEFQSEKDCLQLWENLINSRIDILCYKHFQNAIVQELRSKPQLLHNPQFMLYSVRFAQYLDQTKQNKGEFQTLFTQEISQHYQLDLTDKYLSKLKIKYSSRMQEMGYDHFVFVPEEQDPIPLVVSTIVQEDCLLTFSIDLLKSFPIELDNFQPFLDNLKGFHDKIIVPMIHEECTSSNQRQLQLDINRVVLEIHSSKIIENLFDAILYYPDSLDLMIEFKISIQVTQLFEQMEHHLCQNIQRRLLITGVITQSILTFYINVLKVLQIVDIHGQIFNKVTNPIKEYLLKRSDCLRCIIQLLTSENYDKMTSEKVIIPSQTNETFSSDEEYGRPSVDYRSKYQEKDLVSILISLYGSQEAFINEYQNMLAEKILGARDFHTDDEIKNIELMKMRFGEVTINDYSHKSQMQTSNIIVKDVKESKRVDMNIQSLPKGMIQLGQLLTLERLHPLFLSRTYWPVNYEYKDTFKLPQRMQVVFDEYAKRYEHLKNMRNLLWHYELGSVTIQLTFDNGDFEFRCLPVHAALLEHFDESKLGPSQMIQSDQLAKEMEMSHEDLKRRISFWTHRGVLRAVPQGETKVPIYRKQQSLNEIDSEIICYFPVKQYIQKSDESETNLLDELPDDILESTSIGSFPNVIQHIVTAVLTILKTTGAKPLDKIQQLIRRRHTNECGQNVTENQVKEAIKLLINSEQIFQTGEIYSCA